MNKKSLLITLLLALFLPWTTNAQNAQVIVGDGTSTSNTVPFNLFFNYSYTQQIYTAEQINEDCNHVGEITSISFYYASNFLKTFPVTIFMKTTGKAAFVNSYDWVTMTEGDIVYQGDVRVSSSGWVTFTFPEPFAYDGQSNLLVAVNKGYYDIITDVNWRCTQRPTNQCLYYRHVNTPFNPYNPIPGNSMTTLLPNIMFNITLTHPMPMELAYENVDPSTTNLTWNALETNSILTGYAYQYKKTTETEWSAETTVTTTSVTLDSLESATSYDFQLKALYADGESCVVSTSFTTFEDCMTPENLQFTDITPHEATLTWTESYGDGQWVLQYKLSTENEYTHSVDVALADLPYTITDLEGDKTYDVKIHPVCDENKTLTSNFTTLVACHVPTVVVNDITTNTAKVIGIDTEAEYFSIMLNEEVIAENVNMPYTLTGLTENTTYTVKVKALCGGVDGESVWSAGTSFMTAELCPNGMVCIGAGETTETHLPGFNYYNYSYTQQIYTAAEIGMAGEISSIAFKNVGALKNRNYRVYMSFTDKETFQSNRDWVSISENDLVFSGAVTFAVGEWTTLEFDTPFNYDGTSNIVISVADVTGIYSTPPHMACLAFTASSQALYAYRDSGPYNITNPGSSNEMYLSSVKNYIRLGINELPPCAKPTQLAVDYTGGIEATISWVSDAEAWNLRVNGTEIDGISTNPYTLTGLELNTTYQIEVQSACSGSELSEWSAPVSFTTDMCMPEDQCALTFILNDGYGDGWQGSAIKVIDVETGKIIAAMAAENHGLSSVPTSDTATLSVCDGRELRFVWSNVGGLWDNETSYIVYDVNGDVVFEGSGAMDRPVDYTVSCFVCTRPTELATDAIGPFWAMLKWTENGDATAWNLMVNGELVENVTNPYPLTSLNPETTYTVQVAPVCKETWSDQLTFTTTETNYWDDGTIWDGGNVPTPDANVTIDKPVIIRGNATVSVGNVTIEEGGSLTLEDGAKFYHSNEVPVIFLMNVDGYNATRNEKPAGYSLIATPNFYKGYNEDIKAIPVSGSGLNTGEYDLYMFDQTEELEWRNYKNDEFTTFDLKKGYLYSKPENVTVAFAGEAIPTDSVVSEDLVYGANHEFSGWNLLGNPYTATAYINMPFYEMNEDGDDWIARTFGDPIAPMQGFFVQATGEGQTCTFSTTPQNNAGSLNIELSRTNTLTDRAIVNFGEGKNLGKFQLNPYRTKIYIPQGGKDYAVVTASEIGEMPLSFKAERNGSYTLSFNIDKVSFAYLHLIDNLTGAETDLLDATSTGSVATYTFEAKTTDYTNRFKLVFMCGDSNPVDEFAFYSNGNWVINNPSTDSEATLQVVDVMGRIVKSESISGSANVNINVAPGVYMLRLVNGENVKVQKVVVK